jgi:hypothetical protein
MTEYYYFGMKKTNVVNCLKYNVLVQLTIILILSLLGVYYVESTNFENNCLHECQLDYNLCQDLYFTEQNINKNQCTIDCVNKFTLCYHECPIKHEEFEFDFELTKVCNKYQYYIKNIYLRSVNDNIKENINYIDKMFNIKKTIRIIC